MDRSGGTDFASRRRTLDVPAKPESGLAEWTSKIKELQRQVDADEEAETKRLEEEIAASRMARMRRSSGRGSSTDLSKTDVAAALKEPQGGSPAVADIPRSADERRQNQDDALKKLTSDAVNTRAAADYNSYIASKSMKATAAAAPMSLAAFIGGKATGPRLNKHAPQPDAHDPTQFEQRTIKGPHPIFGRGGIAMPGMVGKVRGVAESHEDIPSPRGGDIYSKSSVPSETFTVKSVVQKVELQRQPTTTQPGAIRSDSPRQRTFSTPAGPTIARTTFGVSSSSIEPKPQLQASSRPISYSPSPAVTTVKGPSRPSTPKEQPSANNHVFPARANTVSPHPRSPVIRSPSPPKTPTLGSSPGLAKPIQPSPKPLLQGPQIPLSQNSSPAFLRPSAAKEPTPSISRLQGRGFVQSMVRASSQLESSSTPSSPSMNDNAPSRKASVLDRWNHGNGAAPVIAPKPLPLRKVRTVEHSMQSTTGSSTPVQVYPTYTPPPPKPEKPEYGGITLRSRTSLPSISSPQEQQFPVQKNDGGADSPTPSQRRALGSSSTMVSYIKPIKTGDGPASPPSRPLSAASRGRPTTPGVDELGVRVRSRTRSIGGDAEERRSGTPGAGVGGKPLNHPTKYRPHKPRKAKAQSPHEEREVHLDRPKVHHVTSTTPVTEERPASLPQEIRPKEAPRPPLLDDDDLSESPPSPGISRRVHFPLSLDVTPAQSHPVHHAEKSPATPIKHSRIPSTGNRATVMDVAQVFSEHEQYTHVLSPNTVVTSSLEHDPSKLGPPLAEEELSCKPNVKSMVANWGPHNIAPTHADASAHNGASAHVGAEKRKSSHEKYSAFALPPLAEEKTPVPSPVGTLTKGTIPPSIESVLREEQPEALSNPQPAPTLEIEKHEIKVPEEPPLHLDIVDEQLPTVDVDALLVDNSGYKADPDVQTISVEVMSIVGASATPISRDTNVFYDTETLAIIHRSKAKLSGLVSTKVWAWRGVRSQSGEKEERKLQELARRYNTPLIPVEQYAEPAELVQVLGGQLATRQGSRAHWTTENTAMHMVRSVDNLTYIDELELSIRNLCSGFSYCLSLLETFYVWHGRGSTVQERQAALTYARNLASQPSNVIELSEESGDDDEMFWIILGEGDYGKADYWRWKSTSESWRARVWLVDTRQNDGIVRPIETFKAVSAVHDHVYIVDCLWEYFVLVGPEARGRRKDIRLALDVASKMSTKLAPTRPYAPTVHVLVLPSRLPIDLRLAFRDMDESYLNQGSVPEHMNLLAAKDAFEHLQKTSWERGLLTDPTMLPLGLADIY